MKDISNEELRNLETSVRPPMRPKKDISDEELISMVQNIERGQSPSTVIPQSKQQTIIEPEMNHSNAYNPPVAVQGDSANYWKINGLPSKGKFYPAGTEIVGRPMKVLEVKKVSSMDEQNGDFILNDVIRKTIRGIDVENLYVADKLFIIFWTRANTYRESGYVVPFVCNKCEKKSDFHFEVDSLEVKEISDEFSPEIEYTLNNGVRIKYDYLKVKDELYIERFRELNRNMVEEIDSELLAMAQMIKFINGKELSLIQKYHWIIELNPGDYSYLKTLMEKEGMGIQPYVNVTCDSCGGTAATAVSFRSDFFVPQYKFK